MQVAFCLVHALDWQQRLARQMPAAAVAVADSAAAAEAAAVDSAVEVDERAEAVDRSWAAAAAAARNLGQEAVRN